MTWFFKTSSLIKKSSNLVHIEMQRIPQKCILVFMQTFAVSEEDQFNFQQIASPEFPLQVHLDVHLPEKDLLQHLLRQQPDLNHLL